MTDLGWAVGAVVGSTVVIAVLLLLVVGRKVGRDRREIRLLTRRARFSGALAGSAVAKSDPLIEAIGNVGAQWALVAVLTTNELDPEQLRGESGHPRLKASLAQQVHDRRPVRRGAAILLLGLLKDADCVYYAAPALRDRDPDVRLVAARALSLTGTDEAAEALLAGLRANALPQERIIERLGHPWALNSLVAALGSADTGAAGQYFHAGVARALALIGDQVAEPALMNLLACGNAEERINAARALGRCGTRRSFAVIRAALSDPDTNVRGQAAAALGELGDVAAVPLLEETMQDPGWWVRSNAAAALAKLGDDGVAALARVCTSADKFAAQRADEQLLLMGRR
jgi:HEAT repeat protein